MIWFCAVTSVALAVEMPVSRLELARRLDRVRRHASSWDESVSSVDLACLPESVSGLPRSLVVETKVSVAVFAWSAASCRPAFERLPVSDFAASVSDAWYVDTAVQRPFAQSTVLDVVVVSALLFEPQPAARSVRATDGGGAEQARAPWSAHDGATPTGGGGGGGTAASAHRPRRELGQRLATKRDDADCEQCAEDEDPERRAERVRSTPEDEQQIGEPHDSPGDPLVLVQHRSDVAASLVAMRVGPASTAPRTPNAP